MLELYHVAKIPSVRKNKVQHDDNASRRGTWKDWGLISPKTLASAPRSMRPSQCSSSGLYAHEHRSSLPPDTNDPNDWDPAKANIPDLRDLLPRVNLDDFTSISSAGAIGTRLLLHHMVRRTVLIKIKHGRLRPTSDMPCVLVLNTTVCHISAACRGRGAVYETARCLCVTVRSSTFTSTPWSQVPTVYKTQSDDDSEAVYSNSYDQTARHCNTHPRSSVRILRSPSRHDPSTRRTW